MKDSSINNRFQNYIKELGVNTDFQSNGTGKTKETGDYSFDISIFGNKNCFGTNKSGNEMSILNNNGFNFGNNQVNSGNNLQSLEQEKQSKQSELDTNNENITNYESLIGDFTTVIQDLETQKSQLKEPEKPQKPSGEDGQKEYDNAMKKYESDMKAYQDKLKEIDEKLKSSKTELENVTKKKDDANTKAAKLETEIKQLDTRINTEKNNKIGNDSQFITFGTKKAEDVLPNKILSTDSVTVNEAQAKDVLQKAGFDLTDCKVTVGDDGTATIRTKDGKYQRVVVDGDNTKIISTKMEGNKATTSVYSSDVKVDKYKPDENGHLNASQKMAMAKEMNDGTQHAYFGQNTAAFQALNASDQSEVLNLAESLKNKTTTANKGNNVNSTNNEGNKPAETKNNENKKDVKGADNTPKTPENKDTETGNKTKEGGNLPENRTISDEKAKDLAKLVTKNDEGNGTIDGKHLAGLSHEDIVAVMKEAGVKNLSNSVPAYEAKGTDNSENNKKEAVTKLSEGISEQRKLLDEIKNSTTAEGNITGKLNQLDKQTMELQNKAMEAFNKGEINEQEFKSIIKETNDLRDKNMELYKGTTNTLPSNNNTGS